MQLMVVLFAVSPLTGGMGGVSVGVLCIPSSVGISAGVAVSMMCSTARGRNVQQEKLFFDEIVGLRIYLALWVATGHAVQMAGVLEPTNPLTSFLLNGHAAVVIFMIVSGFVITNLLFTKSENYKRYITRRFFRLYPAYALCCIVGYFLIDDWSRIMSAVSWQDSPAWQAYAASIHELLYEANENFLPHALLHATMLHGVVPDEVLNRAAMVFLPAAWSISLEWQFYLLAPLLLVVTRAPWRIASIAVVALMIFIMYERGFLGSYDIGSSLAGASPYFLIGILSRLFFAPLSRLNWSPLAATAVVALFTVSLSSVVLPLLIWGGFYCYLLWHRNAPITGRVFRMATTIAPVKLLGEASYSLYLIHRPAQIALSSVLISYASISSIHMLTIQLAAVVLAIPVSVLMYFYIEKPGVRLGHKLAAAIPDLESTLRQKQKAAA